MSPVFDRWPRIVVCVWIGSAHLALHPSTSIRCPQIYRKFFTRSPLARTEVGPFGRRSKRVDHSVTLAFVFAISILLCVVYDACCIVYACRGYQSLNARVIQKLCLVHKCDRLVISVFIPGLPFPGRPGFPAVLIPGFPGIKTPSFPGKRERVKDNCLLNEAPDSYYSAFKRQLLVSYQHHAVPRSYIHMAALQLERTVGCHPCLSGHESRLTT